MEMDDLYAVFLHYANYYASMQMFPYLQCVHFTIMTLKLRAETGSMQFAYSHPLSSWVSTIITVFAGTIVTNFLLGNPLVLPLQDVHQVAMATIIWYLVFFCPFDIFVKLFTIKPLWIVLLVLKEGHRSRNILAGVQMALPQYPDSWLIIVLIATAKGAGSRLMRPVIKFIRGELETSNEALYPSFVFKLSIAGSILFILVHKGTVQLSNSEVLVAISTVAACIQVSMFLAGTTDPFTYPEKLISSVFLRAPKDKATTANGKKKKE